MEDIKDRTVVILIIVYLIILSSNFLIMHDKITGKVAGEVSLFVKAQAPSSEQIGEKEKPSKPIITPEEKPLKELSIEDILKKILEKGMGDKIIDLNINTEESTEISGKDKIFLLISPKLYHYISIKEINNKDATLYIYSESPLIVKLMLKETKEIDLNEDGLNDISIILDDIILGVIKIKIKKLAGINKIIDDSEEIKIPYMLQYGIYTLSIIIIILIISILYIIKKYKKLKEIK